MPLPHISRLPPHWYLAAIITTLRMITPRRHYRYCHYFRRHFHYYCHWYITIAVIIDVFFAMPLSHAISYYAGYQRRLPLLYAILPLILSLILAAAMPFRHYAFMRLFAIDYAFILIQPLMITMFRCLLPERCLITPPWHWLLYAAPPRCHCHIITTPRFDYAAAVDYC